MRILSNVNILGTLDLDNVQNAAADTDRFLVQDANGVVKFRTGAEVASDIGASVGYVSTVKHEVKLGEDIAKGQAVYVTSSDGTNMIVSKASNGSDATSSKTFGLLETGGAANAKVFVITEGLLAGLDTSTAVAGDPVWLGTNGNLLFGVANKPVAPAHMVFIGIVTRVQQNNGEIFVKVQNGFELEELHNVLITGTPVDKAVIQYDTASGLWKNSELSGVTGSGTTNYLPKFTGASTLGNSLIFDNGTNVGINTNAPTQKLTILDGNISINTTTAGLGEIVRIGIGTTSQMRMTLNGVIGFQYAKVSTDSYGQFAVRDGYTSTYPAYSFLNDSNTGISNAFGTADTLNFITNGSERARFTAGGNLLVGSTTDNGLRFQVTGDGYFSGSVGIGTTGLSNTNLNITKNLTGLANVYGIFNSGSIRSDVTTGAQMFTSAPSIQNAVFTLAGLKHFEAVGISSVGSATITSQFGFYVESLLTGATNNYGFFGNIASGTGRWNLYMNGSALNYLNGNLGVGVLPSVWESVSKAIQVGTTGSISSNTSDYRTTIGANTFINSGGSATYLVSAAASQYMQISGTHRWFYAASGTAGNAITFTEGMRLDASGNLGLGVTPSAWGGTSKGSLDLGLYGAVASSATIGSTIAWNAYHNGTSWIAKLTASSYGAMVFDNSFKWLQASTGTAGNAITFTQAMTLDASGNLGIGMTTVPNDAKVAIKSTGSRPASIKFHNASTGDTDTDGFYVGLGGSDGLQAYVFQRENSQLIFATNATESMRIHTDGNLAIGQTSNTGEKLQVNGTMRVSGASSIIGNLTNTNSNLQSFGSTNYSASTWAISIGNGGVSSNFYKANNQYFQNANGITGFEMLSNGTSCSFSSFGASNYAASTWGIIIGNGLGSSNFYKANTHNFQNGSGTAVLTINSTGAATFSSSVTANSFIKTGGLSTEILRADGQVYLFPLAISSPSAGQVLKYNGTSWVNDSDSGITGSGAAGQVAYFTGATTQSGSNNLFWDNTNGRLGVGINTPTAKLDVFGTGLQLASTSFYYNTRIINNNNSGLLFGGNNTSSVGFIAGINEIAFFTYGFSWGERARFTGVGNLLLGSTIDNGLRFQVTGDGYFSGSVGIGATALSVSSLRISKNITGSAAYYSINNEGTVQSDVTANAVNYRSLMRTAAASFTLFGYEHFAASDTTLGAGSSVTNQIGFSVGALTQGTNNFAFRGEVASGTGRWNLYMNGTAANYLAGNLGIGITTPAGNLDVYNATSSSIYNRVGAAGANWVTTSTQSQIGTYTNHPLQIKTNDTSRIYITNGGNVLIGTTTDAGFRLDINGTMRVSGASTFNGNLVIPMGSYDSPSLSFVNDSNTGLYSPLADNLELKTGTNNAVLLENQGVNLMQYSEELGSFQTNFQQISVSIPGNVVAPDGKTNANIAIPDTSLNQHRFWRGYSTTFPFTMSVYAKAAGYNFISLAWSGGVNGETIIFDIVNGTISGTASNHTAQIENVGNGWFRCSLTYTITGGASSFSRWIIVRNANSTAAYSGDGTSGVYLWGWQMEENSAATSYIRTGATAVTRPQAVSILGANLYGNLITGKVSAPSLNDLALTTDYIDRLTIKSTTGNIGIGTSTPGFKLDVVSSSGYNVIVGRGASGSYFETYTIGGTRHASFGSESNGDVYIGSRASNPVYFITNNTTRGYFTSSGNLLLAGAGTSDTGEKLQVTGTMRVSGASTFGGNMALTLTQNAATSFTITNTNIGIAAQPQLKLTSDSGTFWLAKRGSGTAVFKTINAGDSYLYNDTAGNITILNDFATGNINFAAGGSSTAHLTIALTGAATFSSSVTATRGLFGTTTFNSAAILQADSTTQGFLPPRMTAAQRAAISSVPVGLVVYQTDGTEGLYIYTNANGWKSLAIVN